MAYTEETRHEQRNYRSCMPEGVSLGTFPGETEWEATEAAHEAAYAQGKRFSEPLYVIDEGNGTYEVIVAPAMLTRRAFTHTEQEAFAARSGSVKVGMLTAASRRQGREAASL